MKVLVVSYLLNPLLGGGAVTTALNLCTGLVNEGVEVVAVTTTDHREARESYADGFKVIEFRPKNIYWVADKDKQSVLKKVVWQSIDIWNPHVYRYMSNVILAEKPSVVHVNKLRGLSPAIWAAATKHGTPIVQSCHDFELLSPEGSLESGVGRLALNRHWTIQPYQRLRSVLSNRVNVATAPSAFALNTITEMGFFRNSRKVVIPNSHGFTDSELLQLENTPNTPTDDDDVRHFLYLGRLESIKGIDTLCQAFSDVVDVSPCVRLDIAGSGSRFDMLAKEYAHVPQIRFHGHLTGEAKAQLINRAYMIVVPSIVREVFGISIVEAYAYGKPVIASRIGGIPEVISEGRTGILVDPGNKEELRNAILNASREPEAIKAMSINARAAARRYTLESVTRAFVEVYETINQ